MKYVRYAGPLTAKDLPVDALMLVASCAPRRVFTIRRERRSPTDLFGGLVLARISSHRV